MIKKTLYGLGAFLLLSSLSVLVLWNIRPRPAELSRYGLEKKMDTPLPFTVTFLGNTNLLFDDGENAWMTDAFFTRPSATEVLFGQVKPNKAVIQKCLEKAGIDNLDMIIPETRTKAFEETKLLNFYNIAGIRFNNIATNDALVKSKLNEMSNQGWELFTVVAVV